MIRGRGEGTHSDLVIGARGPLFKTCDKRGGSFRTCDKVVGGGEGGA